MENTFYDEEMQKSLVEIKIIKFNKKFNKYFFISAGINYISIYDKKFNKFKDIS